MRRLTLLTTLAASVVAATATVGIALACLPAPDQTIVPAPTPAATPAPAVEHGAEPMLRRCGNEAPPALVEPHPDPFPVYPKRPWTEQDSRLGDALLNHFAAIIETCLPHADDPAGAEAALRRYFVVVKASPTQLRSQGEAFMEATQADQEGFSRWMTPKAQRLERLSAQAAKLSTAVSQMLMRVFTEL